MHIIGYVTLAFAGAALHAVGRRRLFRQLEAYVAQRVSELNRIAPERRASLEKLARYAHEKLAGGGEANLLFICTHNSRRSHMAQIWAQAAAHYYRVPQVRAYSGGTEATAFHPQAVDALKRAGFEIEPKTAAPNPVYRVRYDGGSPALDAFSKAFGDPPNPRENFAAVMTCSDADAGCPFVPGASLRVAVHYEDPRHFDGTDCETAAYDERCRQIAREMLYVFSLIRQWDSE